MFATSSYGRHPYAERDAHGFVSGPAFNQRPENKKTTDQGQSPFIIRDRKGPIKRTRKTKIVFFN